MNIGKQIKQIREWQELSQKGLAQKAQCTQATISHIEGGRDIKLSILERVVNALGWGMNLSPIQGQEEGGLNGK